MEFNLNEDIAAEIERLNLSVKSWTAKTLSLVRGDVIHLGVVSSGELLESLQYRIRKKQGLPDKISLQLKRYGIFQIYGVGRGVKAATASLSSRKKRDWYNVVLEKQLPTLEEELMNSVADIAIRNLPVSINNSNN